MNMEWKPIETAPLVPYQQVLLYDMSFGVCTGYWSPPDPELSFPGDWTVCDGTGEVDGEDDVTHWMPYPEPPSGSEVARYSFRLPPSIASRHDFQWALEMMAAAFSEAEDDVGTPDATDPQEAAADLNARRLFLALAEAALEQAETLNLPAVR